MWLRSSSILWVFVGFGFFTHHFFWCVSLDKVVPWAHLSRTSIPVLDKQSIIISYTLTALDKQCIIISYPNCAWRAKHHHEYPMYAWQAKESSYPTCTWQASLDPVLAFFLCTKRSISIHCALEQCWWGLLNFLGPFFYFNSSFVLFVWLWSRVVLGLMEERKCGWRTFLILEFR
jgi:hypothetical protein